MPSVGAVSWRHGGTAMLAWWRQKSGARGLIGLLISQIIVLQFFLAGIVATEMAVRASADAFAICHGNDQSPPSQPGETNSHVNHAACAVCAFAAHAPPVPADTSHVAILDVLATEVAGVAQLALATSERHSPRTSQGPPLSA
jgi:DUF2946 family protein